MSATVTRRSRTFLHELDLVRVITALSVVAVHVTAFTVIFNTTNSGPRFRTRPSQRCISRARSFCRSPRW